jgi:hypothetical protein
MMAILAETIPTTPDAAEQTHKPSIHKTIRRVGCPHFRWGRGAGAPERWHEQLDERIELARGRGKTVQQHDRRRSFGPASR